MSELYKVSSSQTDIPDEPNKVVEPTILFVESTLEPSLQKEIYDITASDISIENSINKQRLDRFRKEFSSNLFKCLKEQDFEYGVDTPADELVRKMLAKNESVTKEWLNELFVENFSDQVVIIGLLRVISHFYYQEVSPQGPTMALAALSNANAEVRECGIRAFENWSNMESLKVLKNIKCDEQWLNDYLQQVITDIEEELEEHVVVG